MTPEEAQAKAEAFNTKLEEANEAIAKAATKEEIEAVKESIDGLKEEFKGLDKSEEIAELKESLKAQGEALTAMKTNKKENETFGEALKSALEGVQDQLKGLKTNKGNSVRIETKAVGNMTFANVTGQIPQAERESGITRIVRRNPFLLSLLDARPISTPHWEWVEQKNPEGTPAMTAEGALKAQIDFDLVLADAKVKKVTAFIKVSKEMLDDVEALRAEIDQELTERINLVIDQQLLTGDGLGENLSGLSANATPWAAGTFADTIDEANNADVLKVGINQIMLNEHDPNVILMHPSDVTAMELEKASDGHYILPPFRSADGTSISGIRVLSNTGVTQDDFIVADISKYGARIREGLTIDVGYENDDFTKNFVTILAEARLVARIKSNHYGAVVKGTFAASKVLLDPTLV